MAAIARLLGQGGLGGKKKEQAFVRVQHRCDPITHRSA